jgi:hypothetical protein
MHSFSLLLFRSSRWFRENCNNMQVFVLVGKYFKALSSVYFPLCFIMLQMLIKVKISLLQAMEAHRVARG